MDRIPPCLLPESSCSADTPKSRPACRRIDARAPLPLIQSDKDEQWLSRHARQVILTKIDIRQEASDMAVETDAAVLSWVLRSMKPAMRLFAVRRSPLFPHLARHPSGHRCGPARRVTPRPQAESWRSTSRHLPSLPVPDVRSSLSSTVSITCVGRARRFMRAGYRLWISTRQGAKSRARRR
jgi:hypothetical protein